MKRASKRSGFNMAAAVREALSEMPDAKGSQVAEYIHDHYGVDVNNNSLNVAVSQARKKLGIGKGKVRHPAAKRAASHSETNVAVLTAAKTLVDLAGNVELAIGALRQLEDLQLN